MSLNNTLYSWQTTLEKLQNALRELNESSEESFVAFGTKLQEFYFSAKDIAKASSKLVEKLTGNEINAAIDSMRNLLKEMKHFLNQSLESSKFSKFSLQEMEKNI